MKEIDLMIGKYYTHNGNWNYADYKGVFNFNSRDWYAIGESTLFIEDIEPIELSEEILLKCGFDEISRDGLNIRYDFEPYKFGYLDYYNGKIIVTFQSQKISEEIKYLHQLQNLIFALTNEELTVNL